MKALSRLSYDRMVLIGLLAFGVVMFFLAGRIETATASAADIGPAWLPRLFAGALALFAGIALVLPNRSEGTEVPVDRAILFAAALLVAYALGLPALGYVVSTFAALVAMLLIVRAGALWRIGLFSAAFTLTLYVVFAKLLGVALPVGPWRF